MNDQTIQLIRDLAAQLGVASEKLIAIFAHKAQVVSLCWASISLIFFGWAGYALYTSFSARDVKEDIFEEVTPKKGWRVFSAVMASIGVILLLANAADYFSADAAAIKELLSLVRRG